MISTSLDKLFNCGSYIHGTKEYKIIMEYYGKDYNSMDNDDITFHKILELTDLEYAINCTNSRPDLHLIWREYALWCTSLIENHISEKVFLNSFYSAKLFVQGIIDSEQLEAAYQKAYKFMRSYSSDLEWAANSCAMNVSHKHFDTAIYNCFLNSGFALLKFGLEEKELDDIQFKKFLEITMYDDR